MVISNIKPEPVCVCRYFANKLGVRATSNVRELRLALRTDHVQLLALVLGEHNLEQNEFVSIAHTLRPFLAEMRRNIATWCARDARDEPQSDSTARLEPVSKVEVVDLCYSTLLAVLPEYWPGHIENRRSLRRDVQNIVCSARGQHLPLWRRLRLWKIDELRWTDRNHQISLPHNLCELLLYKTLLWLYRNILATVILLNYYVTTTKCTSDETKLFFFRKSSWQSFQDRSLRRMTTAGVIQALRKSAHIEINSLPCLYIVLKQNEQFRPILRYTSAASSEGDVKKRKCFLVSLIKLHRPAKESRNTKYTQFYKKWVELKRPNLYFVKADLSDAFGSVNRNELVDIVCEQHLKYQAVEGSRRRRQSAAAVYRDVVQELLHPSPLRCGRTVYRWRRGLAQGDPLSPLLSELYYSHRDRKHLASFTCSHPERLQLFYRVVDDYLYSTDSEHRAAEFLKLLSACEKLNDSKTVTNFEYEGVAVSKTIDFVGYTYNTKTLSVSRCVQSLAGRICFKVIFAASIVDVATFVSRRLCPPVDAHLLNLHYNTQVAVWSHAYTLFALAANKFCTMLAVCCEPADITGHVSLYAACSMRLCDAVFDTIVRNKPTEVPFIHCMNHMRCLSYVALLLCARGTSRCTALVPRVRGLVARTNCSRGTWRPHSAAPGRPAERTICRRTDFTKFLNACESRPFPFECYNYKHMTED